MKSHLQCKNSYFDTDSLHQICKKHKEIILFTCPPCEDYKPETTSENKRYVFDDGSITDLRTGHTIPHEKAATLLNYYEEVLKPFRKLCLNYHIRLEDIPDILEEYISYDNEEYLEKLRSQKE